MTTLEDLIRGYHRRLLLVNSEIRILRAHGSDLTSTKDRRKDVNSILSKLRQMQSTGQIDQSFIDECLKKYREN